MRENDLRGIQSGITLLADVQTTDAVVITTGSRRGSVNLMLCALGLVFCILLSVTPLVRIPDTVYTLHIAPGADLAVLSSWLPTNLGLGNAATNAAIEFFGLMFLAFLCYFMGARLVQRLAPDSQQLMLRRCIWLATFLCGIIYVVTPAMLSHDFIVYASYSRVLSTYHANPYFVPISVFPHDPFTPINYWAKTVSAYGPIWTLICAFWGLLLKPDPNLYAICFRLFALAMHLLNIWLVGRTLKSLGRSPRTVTLGMLLYGWNPLVLLESSLGGHNDGFMMTFVLTSVLLTAQAEKRGNFSQARGYLPPVIALTLAVLVKFTALPILAAFLLFLACKAGQSVEKNAYLFQQIWRYLRQILLKLIPAAFISLVVTLAFYGPFWLGHDFKAIMASFQNPPSAIYSQNSFLRSLTEWSYFHQDFKPNWLLTQLTRRRFWDNLNYAIILVSLILGSLLLWKRPTTKNFALVALTTMSIVLLITPWFYSWYITWIIGLAVVCLPLSQKRYQAALLALVLIFSLSALWIYPFTNGFLGTHYYLVSLFTTFPPVCTFLIILVSWRSIHNQTPGDIEKQ